MTKFIYAVFAIVIWCAASAAAQTPKDLNGRIMSTVEWLASNKSGMGYDLHSRYTENLAYGDYTFRAYGDEGKTMCVAAIFEVLIRTLAQTKAPDGADLSTKMLPGRTLDGSKAVNILPYAFQYKANVKFPEYNRKFGAGIGDAFVLFGIGRYVTFETAKAGDFIYMNRTSGSGHAALFTDYIDKTGSVTSNPASAAGFRYFSAQKGGTDGMGYRDAFFGSCPPVKTKFAPDCGLIRSANRTEFSVSRLHDPSEWFTTFSAIRIERFFKGESIDAIYADESNFRKKATDELIKANREAAEYASKGLFPLIIPPVAAESKISEEKLNTLEFDEQFGPDFSDN